MKRSLIVLLAAACAALCSGGASAYVAPCPPSTEPTRSAPNAALAKGREAGNQKDYSAALSWFRKAADQGDARAKYNIGVLYEKGLGVEQNYTEALSWYRKAAVQGDVRAEYNIGGLYSDGLGVEQNYTEALSWYRKAADQGDSCAQVNVGAAYSQGLGVAQNDAEAMRWYRMAADQGNATAQFNIGLSYLGGWGVVQDEGQARAWITKAATSDSEEAKNWLAAHPAGALLLTTASNDIPLCDSKETEALFIRGENESREGLAGGLRAQALEGAREMSFDVRAQKRYCSGIGYYNDGVYAVTFELWRDGRGTLWITTHGGRRNLR